MRPASDPGQCSSTARAIAAEALPAPTTRVRPVGGGGRCGGTQRAGAAEAIAASNMARRSARWELIAARPLAAAMPIPSLTRRAADLVRRQRFEDADHGGVVRGGAAIRRGRVEELLRRRRIRQGQAQRLRPFEGEVQILLMQLDAEAGLEIALDHALAMDFENARGGEAAHQR